MKERSEIRNQLKAIRTRVGLSQQELADAAGVARQTISGVEAGTYAVSVAVGLRISKALGCPVEELFWLDDDVPLIHANAVSGSVWNASGTRAAVYQVGSQWIAHPLSGASAFRTEMIPADGIVDEAPFGASVAVRPLDDARSLSQGVAIAGCTPALSLWARSAQRWYPGLRVHWFHANSMDALGMLSRGEVHAAGLHLYDKVSRSYNLPFVRQTLPGRPVVLVNLGTWEEGFVTAPGNPKRITCASDLTRGDVAIANRELGAGSRLLLDDLVADCGASAGDVQGYDRVERSHFNAALAVQSGTADACVGIASVAAAHGLHFEPLRQVRYDLAILKDSLTHEPVRQLISTLDHRWIRTQLEVAGGYDTSRTGEEVGSSGL
ncbi:MAG: substrate-binding domain-containing protein [Capsulimonadaceae bacterium]|nr:substrate-binding domain-containing protein [Capsulimonadaceae bacterium]